MNATVSGKVLDLSLDAAELCGALRSRQPLSCFLDGQGAADRWSCDPLVALDPRVELAYPCASPGSVAETLSRLERILAERRRRGGTGSTGLALLLAYELFDDPATTGGLPLLLAVAVDASVSFGAEGPRLTTAPGVAEAVGDRWRRRLERAQPESSISPARAAGTPTTSLPRERYLEAVRQVQSQIADGEIYQGNLCQRLRVRYSGDPFELYRRTSVATPAPRSAFLETPSFALASISPETFLTVEGGDRIRTRPIKGTRPRGATPEADEMAARELLASRKDRAELLMIVDLERNDLGRVCRVGSVVTPELATLHRFPAVHHLVARVEGRLRDDVSMAELLQATFPGGSITGAPKLRAMQVLRGLEPVPRRYFTGSLFWLGDDGSLDSSILIRSWIFSEGQADLGAGGGIVSDSDPDLEWQESNHKARALTRVLGFEPEEAR